MSSQSPAAVLYDSNGVALAVYNNTAIPASTGAILFAGRNPNGNASYVNTTIDGTLGAAQLINRSYIQVASTVTTSGSLVTDALQSGAQEAVLVVNVGTVTGSGSIQYTIQESDGGVVYGNSATTVVINTGNTPGVFTAVLNVTTAAEFLVTWTVTGTFSATISSHVQTKTTPSTQTVNGTVAVSSISGTVAVTQSTSPWVISGTVNQGTPNTLANAWPITLTDGYGNIQGSSANPIWIQGSISATNPSVGTDGAAFLGFDTQVGGKTTTAAPTYTNGNLDALSLTTLGGLRIDGVYASGTANGTAADLMANGGYVTTAAPTYTTGQLSALSLDTSGNLRTSVNNTVTVTGASASTFNNQSVGSDGAAALAFDTQVGGKVTQAAPSYTAGNLDALSLDLFGNLRTLADGYVTTSAPTYSNNTPSPLSLDTSGNLRVTGFVTTNKATTTSVTSVAQANTNTSLLASNTARIFASIYNNSGQKMYIKLGTTANTTNSYSIQLMPNSYWEVPNDWTGEIDAIWSGAGSGNALVTELSP